MRKEIKMNKIILLGRLTADPEIKYTAGNDSTTVARYQLAVKRKFAKEGQANADFIRCVAFGKRAEFTEKYLRKGIKIVITGRLQTGSYTNEEGQKVYTADVVVEEQEFAESKSLNDKYASGNSRNTQSAEPQGTGDGFMEIPEDTEDLPFN
jgi:single-strand DNA-binding protein